MAKKQPALPGLDKAVAKEVEDAADEYVEVRDKRSALAKKEKEASAVLIVAMRAAKLTSYRYDGHLIEDRKSVV